MSENDLAQRAKENGDKPARPDNFETVQDRDGTVTGGQFSGGLTKREEIAMHVLAALRASESDLSCPRWDSEIVASRAIKDADALLLALEKTKA